MQAHIGAQESGPVLWEILLVSSPKHLFHSRLEIPGQPPPAPHSRFFQFEKQSIGPSGTPALKKASAIPDEEKENGLVKKKL